jgi:hypothetical protein
MTAAGCESRLVKAPSGSRESARSSSSRTLAVMTR